MQKFTGTIEIVDINPYLEIPTNVLDYLQKEAKKDKSPIPVKGKLNGMPFLQTLVKFRLLWRLYLNTPIRDSTQTKVGDRVTIEIGYDPKPRKIVIPKSFAQALEENKLAKKTFEKLPPYRQKEITRYLSFLKSEATLAHNIERTIKFLEGKKIRGVLYY